jgi:isopropylmalate/homocitrate/citramalate synthase
MRAGNASLLEVVAALKQNYDVDLFLQKDLLVHLNSYVDRLTKSRIRQKSMKYSSRKSLRLVKNHGKA